MATLERASTASLETGIQVIELASQVYDLYIHQEPADQRRMLDVVPSNCTLTDEGLTPGYRKPFGLLAQWHGDASTTRADQPVANRLRLLKSGWVDEYRTFWVNPGEGWEEQRQQLGRVLDDG